LSDGRTPPPERLSFGPDQGDIALRRHDLGHLEDWTRMRSNMINAVYKALSTEGCFYVKIQYRKGYSLKDHLRANKMVSELTSLPVCRNCIYDDDTEPFGFPFLIADELPGQVGRDMFEEGPDDLRFEILRHYGRAAATLHGMEHNNHGLTNRDYRDWMVTIRRDLLNDTELISALSASSRKRIPRNSKLLDSVKVELPPVPQGFLWGDAVLQNLLFDTSGRLTGVIDFENAGWGDLLMDQLHIEADFQVRKPREIYGRSDLRNAFWESYEAAGGMRIEPTTEYIKVRRAVQGSGVSWFWKAARWIPPGAESRIEELEGILIDLCSGDKAHTVR